VSNPAELAQLGVDGTVRGGYRLNEGVLERLCRYILRPPLAKDRLWQREDGTVVLGMKRAWSDGTQTIEFSPTDFVGKPAPAGFRGEWSAL